MHELRHFPSKSLACLLLFSTVLAAAPAARAEWGGKAFDGSGSGDSDIRDAAASVPSVGSASSSDDRFWVVVKAGDRDTRTKISAAGVSIEEIGSSEVSGTADPNSLARLKGLGVEIERQGKLSSLKSESGGYSGYAEVQAALSAIASGNKGLASLVSVGTSLQGREITAVRFNTSAEGAAPSDKPGVVFLGDHHAREHLSVEVPLLFAQWLAQNKDRTDVKTLLATRDIYIVPMVNPDGAEYDLSGGQPHYQRKNMRQNADGSLGVDLNRNYGSHWGESGSSTDPSAETYQGPSAFSEPESQAVKKFVDDRPNLRVMASYHSFSELVMYPWSWEYDPIDDGAALKAFEAMAAKMAQWTGYTAEQSSALYASSGDTCDWAWEAHKIFAFTFELTPKTTGDGGFYPSSSVIGPTFQKNLQAMLYMIEMSDNPYRAGNEASNVSGAAKLSVSAAK